MAVFVDSIGERRESLHLVRREPTRQGWRCPDARRGFVWVLGVPRMKEAGIRPLGGQIAQGTYLGTVVVAQKLVDLRLDLLVVLRASRMAKSRDDLVDRVEIIVFLRDRDVRSF